MAIRHNRRTARTELESFRSADVFKLTFKVSFLVLLRGAIAPPLWIRHCYADAQGMFYSCTDNYLGQVVRTHVPVTTAV